MSVKITLLASAPTLDGISDMIARFYGSERKTLDKAAGDDLWAVCRAKDCTQHIPGVRVIRKGRRYRFEAIG
ncbi:MAG TPA: hypothetical protein PLS69_12245 [Terricaulis sp.]|nr:hypothetical protein [Terricaulis sp.]